MDRQTVGAFFRELEKISEVDDYIDDLEAPPVGSVMQYLRAAHGMGKRSSWEDIGPDPSPNVAWRPREKRASISFRQDAPSGKQPLTSDQLRGLIRNATKSPKFRAHMSGLAEEIKLRKQKRWDEQGPIKRTLSRLGIGTPPPEKRAAASLPPVEAYVTGPSGSGKTTYVKKNYPSDRFHLLHSDQYKKTTTTPEGEIKRTFSWGKAIRDARASGKPVVVDSLNIHEPLAQAAKNKILLQVPQDVSIQRRQARGYGKHDADPEEGRLAYEHFDQNMRPVAGRLGFLEKKT